MPMAAHETEKRGERRQKASWIRLIFYSRRGRVAAGVICAAVFLTAIAFLGNIWLEDAMAVDFSRKNLPPGPQYLFGTDWLGRDMMKRTIAGLSLSIRLGCVTAAAGALIALALGTAAALMGRAVDGLISGLIDLMMGIPHMLLLILISYAAGKGFRGVAAGIALTHWPSLARLLRAEALQIKTSQYVGISQKLGMSPFQVAARHLLPQLAPQFLTGLILLFPHAILHEASITFLGFGLPPETPAAGVILSESMSYLMTGKWWLAVFPGAALVSVVLAFEWLGQGLKALLDPGSAHE